MRSPYPYASVLLLVACAFPLYYPQLARNIFSLQSANQCLNSSKQILWRNSCRKPQHSNTTIFSRIELQRITEI